MLLPFLDALAPEIALFEGLATGIAFVGNTALGIKDMVEHPENAFIDILGIVMDGCFSRAGKAYKVAAGARFGISDDLIEKSGKTIKQLDDKLQDVFEKACAPSERQLSINCLCKLLNESIIHFNSSEVSVIKYNQPI